MSLGTAVLKNTGHTKSQTLCYAHDHMVDAQRYAQPMDEIMQMVEHLKTPGWRLKDAEPRPPPSPEVVPKNCKWPRVAPAWLKHDGQVLRFNAFFQESVVERWDENSRYRHVIIMYFVQDGTFQIFEPKIENSGISQGKLLRRHQVPHPDGCGGFLGPFDFHIGQEIQIYGIQYRITGCDPFTRWFFKENGYELGEDDGPVKDRWTEQYNFTKAAERGTMLKSVFANEAKHLNNYMLGVPPQGRALVQFLLNDKKVLRFKGYWDDHTPYGVRIYFVIHFFLADNTVEMNEAHCRNSGRDAYPVFYRRGPLLKENRSRITPGMLQPDPIPYEPKDFRVGETIDVWNRKVVLYDCDDFTRKFYKEYLGIDQAENKLDVSEMPVKHFKMQAPPHNGIGSEEDSMMNVTNLQPKPAKQDLVRKLTLAGEILRFEAKLVNGVKEDENRRFIVGYFPSDSEVAVWETAQRNSGHMAGKFAEKRRMRNPDTGRYFEQADFAVGNTVSLASQAFCLMRADEHTLQFLERDPSGCPYADPMECARKLAPLSDLPQMRDEGGIDPDALKELAADAGVHLIDHEVITLLRAFCVDLEGVPLISGPKVLEVLEQG